MAEVYSENQIKKPKKINKKTLIFLIALTLLFFVTAGGAISYLYSTGFFRDPNILATVGGENITKADLNARIYATDFGGTPNSPTAKVDNNKKKELLQELIENKVIAIETEKLGINVTDGEISKEVLKRAPTYNQQTETEKAISRKSVKAGLLKEKLQNRVLGVKEGSYILVNYTKNFSSNMSASADQKAKENLGRDQRIKEDADYAKTLITSI